MENLMAFPQHYADHQRQLAWINDHDRQFDRPKAATRIRTAVVQALLSLAAWLAPSRPERQAVSQ